jgi:hypothetical protein
MQLALLVCLQQLCSQSLYIEASVLTRYGLVGSRRSRVGTVLSAFFTAPTVFSSLGEDS